MQRMPLCVERVLLAFVCMYVCMYVYEFVCIYLKMCIAQEGKGVYIGTPFLLGRDADESSEPLPAPHLWIGERAVVIQGVFNRLTNKGEV
ncbi:hypothetical protein B484DRAFT_198215 [Ochromonadaceae sp. CCMP2298]|nr:hypothetical protein B484DRAFT_198215 [Ochromonadaceae sp. CCMP2298]